MNVLEKTKKPTTFFVGSANDLFAKEHEFSNYSLASRSFSYVDLSNLIGGSWVEHTLLFLTKNPIAYESFKWAENKSRKSFFGASLDGKHYTDFNGGHDLLDFISVEPLLAPVKLPETSARAVIIGGLTGHGSPYKHTPIEWVDDVVKQALDSGMKVFIKDNLKDYIAPLEAKHGVSLRQLLWEVRG
jgi:protein gp37